MKLYIISQDVNDEYDTYDSAVVCAKNKEEARKTSPGSGDILEWAAVKDIKVEYLGEAKKGLKKGVVITSFNAG